MDLGLLLEEQKKEIELNTTLQLLLLNLSDEGFVSISELVELLGTSRRSVFRYLAKLKDAGYPIETKEGPHGGVKFVEGFYVAKYGFTSKQIRLISTALNELSNKETLENQIEIKKLLKILSS